MKYLHTFVFLLLACLCTSSLHAQCSAPSYSITSTCHQINFNWSPVTGADHYEYVLDTSIADPKIKPASTTSPGITIYPLRPGQHYFFHVRTICTGGDSSFWNTSGAQTTCDSITSINITETFDSSANFVWTTAAHCENHFQYAVDTSVIPPTDPAAWKTATGLKVTGTGLIPNTTYFVFVRDSCGNGFSTPMGNHFQTQPLAIQSLSASVSPMRIYPNPAKDLLTVDAPIGFTHVATISLIDVLGRQLQTWQVSSGKTVIDVSQYTSGIYFLKYSGDKGICLQKMYKQ